MRSERQDHIYIGDGNCGEEGPRGGTCTLPRGHSGNHVGAYERDDGWWNYPEYVWPNTSDFFESLGL